MPLTAALIPALLFFGLTELAAPTWPGLDPGSMGYLTLALGHALPLFVLCCRATFRWWSDWSAIAIAAFGATALGAHGGLSTEVITDLDSDGALSATTWLAASGCFLAAFSIPAGLLAARATASHRLALHIALPALAGAAGQIGWFGLARLVEGPTGLEYWLWSRVAIHTAAGAVAGVLAGGARLFRPPRYLTAASGPVDLMLGRLPGSLALSAMLALGITATAVVRISVEHSDTSRFYTIRLDDYFLALSNLFRAEDAGLAYPGLHDDLARARRALGGAADFDPALPGLIEQMCRALEERSAGQASHERFKNAVSAVNRRMMAIGEPHFLEPQALSEMDRPVRFLLRYSIAATTRFRLQGGGTAPVLRLRRLDDMLIDTPYTGLSYPGLGTVLMDHVDDVALRSYAMLFAPRTAATRLDDGRFAQTRAWLRTDRRDGFAAALARRGHRGRLQLEQLAAIAARWAHRMDVRGVRTDLDASTLAVYDAMSELLARQTEIHEARHAFDGELEIELPALDELSAGRVSNVAAAEIRAHLTEVVDGPLGPRFALAKLANLVAGEDARANAYFFAGIVVLEGLWGEPIRRPDVAEREGPDGPRHVFLPMTKDSPGWLSYSRIHGAYGDLRALAPDDLRQRARELFERLFGEEYQQITRLR
jgi:hypothetical protein